MMWTGWLAHTVQTYRLVIINTCQVVGVDLVEHHTHVQHIHCRSLSRRSKIYW